MQTIHKETHSSRQITAEIVFLLAAVLAGTYYRILTASAHRKTFSGTRTVIESRIKLECEREQQEQLLLSVIPAYIAAEVSHKSVLALISSNQISRHSVRASIMKTTATLLLLLLFACMRKLLHSRTIDSST